MKTFMKLLFLLLPLISHAQPPSVEGERVKLEILKNREQFSKLLSIPVAMITEDELNHCHGQLSSNADANLIGSCYFSENGSLYILAITEKMTKSYKIKYPVYQVMQITSEL